MPVTAPNYGAKMGPCENACGGKASKKEKYNAYLCVSCVEKLEKKAARAAIRDLQKGWRER